MVIAVNLNADILGKERRIGSAVPTVAGFDLLNELNEHEDEVKRGTIGSLARRVFRREPTHPSMIGVMISSLGIVQDRIDRKSVVYGKSVSVCVVLGARRIIKNKLNTRILPILTAQTQLDRIRTKIT